MNINIRPFLLILAAALLAWSPPVRASGSGIIDVTGHLPRLQFTLLSDDSKMIRAADFLGHPVLLYFGYTGCPDRCPATLSRLAATLQSLDDNGTDIRILFVTVDPQQDTPYVMHTYIRDFDPRTMIGMTGPQQNIAALARTVRAAYRPGRPAMHSNGVYAYDRKGKARAIISPDISDEAMSAFLRELAGS